MSGQVRLAEWETLLVVCLVNPPRLRKVTEPLQRQHRCLVLSSHLEAFGLSLFKLCGGSRRISTWAHEVSPMSSRTNLVEEKKKQTVRSVNFSSLYQGWHCPISLEFIAFQWGGCLRCEEHKSVNINYWVWMLWNLPALYDSWEGTMQGEEKGK